MTTASGDEVLRLDGVSVAYDGHPAIRDVDLTLQRGETLSLLGASGSGKTTLLRVVAGLVAPDAGRVVLDGRDLGGVPPHRRGVGLQFQDFALFPHLDVGANVGFGLRMRGLSLQRRDARVSEVLELVGLPRARHRDVAQLSGGEQQRVALARALAPAPAVLLLDEPLGALDRALRERLVAELSDLFDRLGQSVISVTHDVGEAFALADRLAVLDHGRLVQVGAPRELWRRPAAPSVARLLGFENLVEADVVAGVAATPWGRLPAPGIVGGRHTLLVRPDGVHRDPDGSISGRVGRVVFAGDHDRVQVETGGGPLQVLARWSQRPQRGEGVRLSVEPGAVVVMEGDRPPGIERSGRRGT